MTGIQQTVAVWAPSMVPFGRSFRDQTVRMVVRPSAGGTRARLRLSNLHGPAELTVGAVSVAPEGRPPRPVSFDGATKAVIGRGRELLTDVLPVDVERGQNLLVSVYLPGSTGPSTHHRDAFETTYVSAPRSGDLTAEDGLDGFTATETSWYFLAGLTVTTDEVDGTLVAFGTRSRTARTRPPAPTAAGRILWTRPGWPSSTPAPAATGCCRTGPTPRACAASHTTRSAIPGSAR